MSDGSTPRVVDRRSLEEVTGYLRAIEQTMADLDMNERVNILTYALAGYVVAMLPAGTRERTAKAIGKALTFVCLPVMEDVGRRTGTDFETLSRPQ